MKMVFFLIFFLYFFILVAHDGSLLGQPVFIYRVSVCHFQKPLRYLHESILSSSYVPPVLSFLRSILQGFSSSERRSSCHQRPSEGRRHGALLVGFSVISKVNINLGTGWSTGAREEAARGKQWKKYNMFFLRRNVLTCLVT